MNFLKNFLIEEDGQDMVEYGLLIALVVLGAVASWGLFNTKLNAGISAQGTSVNNVFNKNAQ